MKAAKQARVRIFSGKVKGELQKAAALCVELHVCGSDELLSVQILTEPDRRVSAGGDPTALGQQAVESLAGHIQQ